ncbi:MAG: dinitrogenase iron-molybdenum cofactor biosynthesis protein [Methanobacterium sp.]|uniref:NifB/NifX family molybdenum-iron cluster-binding protein n=1 Tax=Methanobacterium sp. TaxID=2164 RepID=UPI003D648F86|nr:dinitrogenase iron-molybdenum cofactor biosynthesis protein [Methanobacterium sp.]
MKIAVATSNGKDVDHFGKAQEFKIYEFDANNVNFIEKRESPKVKGEKHQWQKSLDTINDCDVIICVQAGLKGKFGLKNAGIKIVEDEGLIGEVLERFIDHLKFMEKSLF